MEALRVLTAAQSKCISLTFVRAIILFIVREYHASYYVPHNLSLIVGGKLSSGSTSLLSVIQERVEPTLIKHGQNKGPRPESWKRPFVETRSAKRIPLVATVRRNIQFPEQDESKIYILSSDLYDDGVQSTRPW